MTVSKVAIVGGGLVGALNACYFAKRGFEVELYEYRDDIRTMEHVTGKSINLALSFRGRLSLNAIGLEQELVREHGIPMYGRMIHQLDGQTRPIAYGTKDEYIISISRRHLNELLLTAAEKFKNVNIHFQHKLISADLLEGKGTFRNESTKQEITVAADLIVGCDGAHSVVRKEMTKLPGFNYSQQYIKHGYKELCIPPTADGKYAMEKNYLHIWPRSTFMLIALPNQDKSWTVTLFMPLEDFVNIKTADDLLHFFRTNFPDVIPLIGQARLVQDFFAVNPAFLMSVKCRPYNIGSRSLIMGDAAHAMVPFYGQGMNAGFEDCFILDRILDENNNNFTLSLPKFSAYRNPDAEVICDLAMYNYIEMRDLVNTKMFLLRKKLDNFFHYLFPRHWIPLYSMVTFSNIRYHEALHQRNQQDQILKTIGYTFEAVTVGIVLLFFIKHPRFIRNLLEK